MRFVIIGAGAVGSTVAVELHEAGQDVTLVARGRNHDALQSGGLKVARPWSTSHLALDVASGPHGLRLRSDDVLMVSVKSQDTARAVAMWAGADVFDDDDALMGLAGQHLPIVCLQNGVENERVALRYFDHVVGASVWIPCQLAEPGLLLLPGSPCTGAMDLGRYPHGVDRVSQRLSALLSGQRIVARASDDVMRLKFFKLFTSLDNAFSALFRPSPALEETRAAAKREAREVMMKSGVSLDGLENELARIAPLTALGALEAGEYVGNSTVQALVAGAGSLETDYFNGEIAMLGELNGVAAPVNRAVQAIARQAASQGASPQSLDIDDVHRAMGRA